VKKIGLMILGGFSVAMIAFIATAMSTYYMLSKKVPQPRGEQALRKVDKAPLPIYPLEEFIVNLADPGHYLKAVIALEVNRPMEKQEKEKHGGGGELMDPEISPRIPKIRDAIITILTTKRFEELSTPQGKEMLKRQIRNKINSILGKELVSNVYFTSFTMQ
jgi:flagellar FliL protein